MKKLFFLLLAIVSVSTFAQTRKVAILETVDRENKLPYGIKLMLRSNLAKGVAETKGYEAFERTQDLNKIFDEQTFQRTGNVSDEEIRKIGELTGVQYILIAEASMVNANKIFVTAKILNVETARVEITDNIMMKNNANSVQKGAKKLASGMLKPYIVQTKTTPPVVEPAQPDKKDTKKTAKVTAKTPEPAPIIKVDTIERVSREEYKLGSKWMTRKEYYEFINNRDLCIPAYQQFSKGLKLEKVGKWTMIVSGGVLLVGTLTTAIGIPVNEKKDDYYYDLASKYYRDHNMDAYHKYIDLSHECYRRAKNCEIAGPCLMGIGGAGLISGVTMWAVGISKKDNAYKAYNSQCAYPMTLNLKYTGTGLGLALEF